MSEQLPAALIEALDEGVIVVAADGRVIVWNTKAEEFLGVADIGATSMDAPPVAAFFEDGSRVADDDPARRVLVTGKPERDLKMRFERDGADVWLNTHYFPLREGGGDEPYAVVCTFSDITESRRVAQELDTTEQTFRDVADAIHAVFWRRDLRRDEIVHVSSGYEDIWGRDPRETHGPGHRWLEGVHPDDRERVRAAAARYREAGYDVEYRVVRPDGTTRWIRDRAFPVRETAGEPTHVTGIAEDITERRRTEEALESARERARSAFTHAPTGNAVFGVGGATGGRPLEVNAAFCRMLGLTEEEALATSIAEIVHPDDQSASDGWSRLVTGEVDTYQVERRLLRGDGRTIWARIQMSLLRDGRGEVRYGFAQLEDVTERRRGAAQQQAIVTLGERALEGLALGPLMEEAVALARETLGVTIASVFELLPDQDVLVPRARAGWPEELADLAWRPVPSAGRGGFERAPEGPLVVPDWETEERIARPDELRAVGARSGVFAPITGVGLPWGTLSVQSVELRDFTPDEVNFLASVANILATAIERWRSEEETRHRALHDPLTGLPNRTLFHDRLEHALERSQRRNAIVAVLFMDLDHFKVINDSLGHRAGDELLCAFAPRLAQTLRPSDTVARFGGDEFVVLCEDLPSEREAVELAERLMASFVKPLEVAGQELFTTATIGVAVAAEGATPEGLIGDADAAMYRAKARGRARYELFDAAMRKRVSDRLRTENGLRRALARDELELYYQPLISLADGALVGAEALLRWHEPDRGWIPPSEFIPIAEESGLIVAIGAWVLERAAREARTWEALSEVGGRLVIAVNLSAREVATPDFADGLERVLLDTGLEPGRVALEITETVLMEEAEAPIETVRRLKAIGIRLVLDDFGTGYSSLSYLNRLPIDVLKLDRSFIAPLIEDSPQSAAIIAGVVTMAQALGLTVVAEGVEHPAQLARLRELGCEQAQGFHFARPMPAREFAELVTGAGRHVAEVPRS